MAWPEAAPTPLTSPPAQVAATRDEMAGLKAKAEAGDALAQYDLGVSYRDGDGIPKDEVKAAEWFRKAADQGLVTAQFNLAVLYDHGQGVKRDDAFAVAWYRKAADKGLVEAQVNLANFYLRGRGVSKDPRQAVAWYRKAADQDSIFAQYNLGLLYQDGEGVKQDDAAALMWFLKSARQGDADAQREVGEIYFSGKGVRRDDAEAARWYRKAAEQGDTKAQFDLGVMTSLGLGLPKDLVESHKWLSLASANALGPLAEEYAATRDGVARLMTPQQLVEARKRAKAWLAARLPEKQTARWGRAELVPIKNGRDDRIRTCDPLTPSQVRYQAALHPGSRAKRANELQVSHRTTRECTRTIRGPEGPRLRLKVRDYGLLLATFFLLVGAFVFGSAFAATLTAGARSANSFLAPSPSSTPRIHCSPRFTSRSPVCAA